MDISDQLSSELDLLRYTTASETGSNKLILPMQRAVPTAVSVKEFFVSPLSIKKDSQAGTNYECLDIIDEDCGEKFQEQQVVNSGGDSHNSCCGVFDSGRAQRAGRYRSAAQNRTDVA